MAQLGNVFDILQFNFHAVKGRAAANPIVVQCTGRVWPAAARAARFPSALQQHRKLPWPAAAANGSRCCTRQPLRAAGRAQAPSSHPGQREGPYKCHQPPAWPGWKGLWGRILQQLGQMPLVMVLGASITRLDTALPAPPAPSAQIEE